MNIPQKEWLTIADLSNMLEIPQCVIEHYFMTGKLLPSIYITDVVYLYEVEFILQGACDEVDVFPLYSEPDLAVEGVYGILDYQHISWKVDNGISTTNLLGSRIYLTKDNSYFTIASNFRISKNDIIVTQEEISRFTNLQEAHLKNVQSESEIDLNHKYTELGKKFFGKGKGFDELTKLCINIQKEHLEKSDSNRFLSWNQILHKLRKINDQGFIHSIEDETELITWGDERETTFKGLRDRLTRIKKFIRAQKDQ